jgi:FMN reductase
MGSRLSLVSGGRVQLLIVLGSATPPGRLRRALSAATERPLAATDVELLDLAELRLGLAGAEPAPGDENEAVIAAVSEADAVVFATPVYRGSMTGVLKNLIDLLPLEALARKPVGLVARGASDRHFLGAERHLRDVLAFFGALVAPIAIYLRSVDFEDGEPGAEAVDAIAELLAEVSALEQFESQRDDGAPAEGDTAKLYRQRNR